MQLRVVVEHIMSGKLVQLSQHAQPVVSLTFFDQGWKKVILFLQ